MAVNEIEDETRTPYRWRVRLSDRQPQKTAVIVLAGCFAFGIGAGILKNFALGLVGFAIILGSTAEFWLGSVFTVDEKGVSVRTGLSYSVLAWENVKRVVKDGGGIKLSPLDKPGTMDAFRGVYLRYGSNNREEIERAVTDFGRQSDNHVVERSVRGGDERSD